MQRAAIVHISAEGIATLGRDGGGSAGQKGRLEVRPGGGVVWAPLIPGQETAQVPPAVQGLAPGEVPQAPPPAVGHALGVSSEPQAPPTMETKDAPGAEGEEDEEKEPAGPPAPGATPPGPDPQPV